MTFRPWIAAVLILPATAAADTTADAEAAVAAAVLRLADPDPEIRSAAAAELRGIVAASPSGTTDLRRADAGEAFWRERATRVVPGMTEAEVHKLLPPMPGGEGSSHGSGDSHNDSYRIDPHWVVGIVYRNPDKAIDPPSLRRSEQSVYVTPPEGFTGLWTTYFVNGRKRYDIEFRDGQYDGVFTSYFGNGRKSYEQRYAAGVAHGSGTGWHDDGRLNDTARYADGKQDGTWTHRYRDGVKQAESTYKAGVKDGRHANWSERGVMLNRKDYRDGVLIGEAGWNADGRLAYERFFPDGKP